MQNWIYLTFILIFFPSNSMESFWVQTAISAIRALAFVCDVITFPVYLILQRPWRRRQLSKRIKVSEIIASEIYSISHIHFCRTEWCHNDQSSAFAIDVQYMLVKLHTNIKFKMEMILFNISKSTESESRNRLCHITLACIKYKSYDKIWYQLQLIFAREK